MAYASLPDIQTWLARDKLVVDDAMSKGPLIEAERLIRGQLVGVFTILTVSTWTDPDNTPEIIRGIAGRLTACFIYRNVYSEEGVEVPPYAMQLYSEAVTLIGEIIAGNIVVIGPDGNPIIEGGLGATMGGQLSFWPDDTVAPKFTMDQQFA